MNKYLLILFLLFTSYIKAQINVGSEKSVTNLYLTDIKEDDFKSLKATKTIVVIPSILDEEKFKAIFKDSWDVTQYEFVNQNEYADYYKNKIVEDSFSVLSFSDNTYRKVKTKGGDVSYSRVTGEVINASFYLSLYTNRREKKGKIKYDIQRIAKIFLSPSIRVRTEVIYSSGRKSTFGKKKKLNSNKETEEYYTLDYGYLKNFFQNANDYIKNESSFGVRDGFIDKNNIKRLQKEVLYVPDWMMKRFNGSSGMLSEIATPSEYFEEYNYEYKVISSEELNKKIMVKEPILYALHTQYNFEKVFAVFDAVNGKYLYVDSGKFYNIKSSDIKKLSKAISK